MDRDRSAQQPLDDDRTLLSRIADGDVSSLMAFYDRHSALAFGLALRLTPAPDVAERLVEAAILDLWRGRGSHRIGALDTRARLVALLGRAYAMSGAANRAISEHPDGARDRAFRPFSSTPHSPVVPPVPSIPTR